jgi:hypothetical protein
MEQENSTGRKDSDIQKVLWFCMVSSFLMCCSIMGNYQLFIRWQRTKNYIIETDNLFNTGLYKTMLIECFCVLI